MYISLHIFQLVHALLFHSFVNLHKFLLVLKKKQQHTFVKNCAHAPFNCLRGYINTYINRSRGTLLQ